jgi:hypothetical protein
VKCRNIISKDYKRNIDALNIDALNIDARNIDALNIDARNINAWNIDARNINALNIDALSIDARNINADFIVCEKRIKKKVTNKTVCKNIIQNCFTLTKTEKELK